MVVREYVGGACSVEARYYEEDGAQRQIVTTRTALYDSEDLLGFEAVVSAGRRMLSV